MRVSHYRLIAILAVCIAGAGLLVYRYEALWLPDAEEGPKPRPDKLLPKPGRGTVHLYFSDSEDSFLKAEERVLALPNAAVQRARKIVEALIEGPRSPLIPTIPDGTKVLSVYTTEDGIVCIDFSRGIIENHPGGTRSELLTIFSVVNTLAANIPDMKAVKILIEGRGAKTLAGHIDIRFPLRPDMDMIKEGGISKAHGKDSIR
jgi:hypothetical protein